jgi:hypothetical protein
MRALGTLVIASLLVVIGLRAQKANPAAPSEQVSKTFRLDPRWPFVYLKFDHIGAGKRRSDNEPSTRIWLHLVNNSRLPIVVRGGQPIDGGLQGEVSIDNVVRLNPPIYGLLSASTPTEPDLRPVATTLTEPGQRPNPNDSSSTSPTQSKSSRDDEASMPVGYPSFDVVSTDTIMPGTDVLFSVPANFVTKKWHFEINVSFGSEGTDERIPEQSSFVDSNVRGHVEMTLSYGFYDLPKEYQDEVEKFNQEPQKKP